MEYPDVPGYEIDGVLGKGAMGCVYSGRHLESGEPVAIKALLHEDPSLHRALANEWEVLIRVEHPFLVNERELLTQDGASYLVMERIPGITLQRWIEEHSLEQRVAKAGAILGQICQVMQYLHSQNPPVIVRDLKPENVLITDSLEVKLIDFGIARSLVANGRTEIALKGFASEAYSPLEQYSADSTTGIASDVYSLGATAFHLLSGKAPPSALDLLTHKTQPEQLLRDLGVRTDWAQLVGAAMRLKPPQRISLNDFIEQLPGTLSERPSQRVEPAALPSRAAPTTAASGSGSWAGWIGVLLLLLLAVGLFLMPQPEPPPPPLPGGLIVQQAGSNLNLRWVGFPQGIQLDASERTRVADALKSPTNRVEAQGRVLQLKVLDGPFLVILDSNGNEIHRWPPGSLSSEDWQRVDKILRPEPGN